jgi:hypothetical protein
MEVTKPGVQQFETSGSKASGALISPTSIASPSLIPPQHIRFSEPTVETRLKQRGWGGKIHIYCTTVVAVTH